MSRYVGYFDGQVLERNDGGVTRGDGRSQDKSICNGEHVFNIGPDDERELLPEKMASQFHHKYYLQLSYCSCV